MCSLVYELREIPEKLKFRINHQVPTASHCTGAWIVSAHAHFIVILSTKASCKSQLTLFGPKTDMMSGFNDWTLFDFFSKFTATNDRTENAHGFCACAAFLSCRTRGCTVGRSTSGRLWLRETKRLHGLSSADL